MANEIVLRHLQVVWIFFVCGILSGGALGLLFHRQGFLGGYSSWQRRLCRLGHIAWFGMGFVQLGFALTCFVVPTPLPELVSLVLITGGVLMPLTCYLSAWSSKFRHLFALPVTLLLGSCIAVCLHLS